MQIPPKFSFEKQKLLCISIAPMMVAMVFDRIGSVCGLEQYENKGKTAIMEIICDLNSAY